MQSAGLQAAFGPGREAGCALRLRSLAWAPRRVWGHSVRVRHVLPAMSLLSSARPRQDRAGDPATLPGQGPPHRGAHRRVCVSGDSLLPPQGSPPVRAEMTSWGAEVPGFLGRRPLTHGSLKASPSSPPRPLFQTGPLCQGAGGPSTRLCRCWADTCLRSSVSRPPLEGGEGVRPAQEHPPPPAVRAPCGQQPSPPRTDPVRLPGASPASC